MKFWKRLKTLKNHIFRPKNADFWGVLAFFKISFSSLHNPTHLYVLFGVLKKNAFCAEIDICYVTYALHLRISKNMNILYRTVTDIHDQQSKSRFWDLTNVCLRRQNVEDGWQGLMCILFLAKSNCWSWNNFMFDLRIEARTKREHQERVLTVTNGR